MRPARVMRILIEEAVRAMAVFGFLYFSGIAHLLHQFTLPAPQAIFAILGLACLSFVVLVPLRLTTGRAFKVASRRGWFIVGAAVTVLTISLDLVVHLMIDPEAPWFWWRALGAMVVGAFFTALNRRKLLRIAIVIYLLIGLAYAVWVQARADPNDPPPMPVWAPGLPLGQRFWAIISMMLDVLLWPIFLPPTLSWWLRRGKSG